MSQTTDLEAIRQNVKTAKLPAEVRKSALWHLDQLPALYQNLEKTCESRFLDEILRQVKCMLKTINVPSSVESVTNNFQAMHERHGIPSLALKPPVVGVGKPVRAKKAAATSSV